METSKNITMYIIIYVILLIFLLSNIKEKTAIFSVFSLILILKSDIKINNMIMFIAFFMFVIQSLDLIQSNNLYEGYVDITKDGQRNDLQTMIPIKYMCDDRDVNDINSRKCDIINIDKIDINYQRPNTIRFLPQANKLYKELLEEQGGIREDLFYIGRSIKIDECKTNKRFNRNQFNETHQIMRDNKLILEEINNLLGSNASSSNIEGMRSFKKFKKRVNKNVKRRVALGKGIGNSVVNNYKIKNASTAPVASGSGYYITSENNTFKVLNDYDVISRGGLFLQHIDLTKDDIDILKRIIKPAYRNQWAINTGRTKEYMNTFIINWIIRKIGQNNNNGHEGGKENSKLTNLHKFFKDGSINNDRSKKRIKKYGNEASFPLPETIINNINFKSSKKTHEIFKMVNSPIGTLTSDKKNTNQHYVLLYNGKFKINNNGIYKFRLKSNYYSFMIINDEDPWDNINKRFNFNNDTIIKDLGNWQGQTKTIHIDDELKGNKEYFITILYFVGNRRENLKFQWKKRGRRWCDLLTKKGSDLVNNNCDSTNPDITYIPKTKYFNHRRRVSENSENSENSHFIAFRSEAHKDMYEGEQGKRLIEKFEGCRGDPAYNNEQCSLGRLGKKTNGKCRGFVKHTYNIRILRKNAQIIKEYAKKLQSDTEYHIYYNIIKNREDFIKLYWLRKINKLTDKIEKNMVPLDELKNHNSYPETTAIIKNEGRVIKKYNKLKEWINRPTRPYIFATFDNLNPRGLRNTNGEILPPYTKKIYLHNIGRLPDMDNLLDGIKMNSNQFPNMTPQDIETELDAFYKSINYHKYYHEKDGDEILPFKNNNRHLNNFLNTLSKGNITPEDSDAIDQLDEYLDSIPALKGFQEGFHEGYLGGNNNEEQSEKVEVSLLEGCLNDYSNFEDSINCFTTLFEQREWFRDNIARLDSGKYEFTNKIDLTKQMRTILIDSVLPITNLYIQIVDFVNRVKTAYDNYIKNGPKGLVKLFNLDSSTASDDGISYDEINSTLGDIMSTTLDGAYSDDDNILKNLQDKLEDDPYYIDFGLYDLHDIKLRVNIITEQELYIISQHYKGRATGSQCSPPQKISQNICSYSASDTRERCTPFEKYKTSACCFIPGGEDINYPPAKLY